jgi:hypothetical protein
MTMRAIGTTVLCALAVVWIASASAAATADRGRLEEFLEVTGFDIALESIRLSAKSAPDMLGLEAERFGDQWTSLTREVFATDVMHGLALDMLEKTLSTELLEHAIEFYRSDLGTRIVAAENASHMSEDDAAKTEAGEAIVSALVQHGSDRIEHLRRMVAASDSAENSVRAIHEVQVRFLMAAAGAGIIELRMDEDDLRALLSSQSGELVRSMQLSALSNAAYTYQAFSDEEIAAYADALEHPQMREVYDLMNAVQFEVMANRFEALATRMGALQPITEL